MKCSVRVRTSWPWPAIGLLVWLGITTGLLQRNPSALGDQVDRDLWPLRVSDDGRSFTHADGSPFFPVIDTVWMLSYLAPEDVDFYVTHRPAKGFNAVYVSLAGVERLPAGLNSPNYRGHRPFAQNAAGPDTTRPNPAFFEDFKPTLHKLREHKLSVFLVVGWAAAWQQSFTRESYARYVEFVLDQYPTDEFPHIVWCIGGDKGMFMQKDLDKPMQIEAGRHFRRMMDARDDRRLIGDHPGRGSSVINYTPEEAAGWLDFYTVQSGHRGPTQDVADWVRQVYERRPAKFDPTSGQFTKPRPRLPNSGTQVFQVPGKNHAGQRDWMLVLSDVQ